MSKPYDNTRFSFRARLRSFRYAAQGIVALIRGEHNARIHLVAALLAVASALWLRISSVEWCIVIILIGAVFSPLIKKAKDLAAAAVLFMAIVAVVIAAVIFIPKLLAL